MWVMGWSFTGSGCATPLQMWWPQVVAALHDVAERCSSSTLLSLQRLPFEYMPYVVHIGDGEMASGQTALSFAMGWALAATAHE